MRAVEFSNAGYPVVWPGTASPPDRSAQVPSRTDVTILMPYRRNEQRKPTTMLGGATKQMYTNSCHTRLKNCLHQYTGAESFCACAGSSSGVSYSTTTFTSEKLRRFPCTLFSGGLARGPGSSGGSSTCSAGVSVAIAVALEE